MRRNESIASVTGSLHTNSRFNTFGKPLNPLLWPEQCACMFVLVCRTRNAVDTLNTDCFQGFSHVFQYSVEFPLFSAHRNGQIFIGFHRVDDSILNVHRCGQTFPHASDERVPGHCYRWGTSPHRVYSCCASIIFHIVQHHVRCSDPPHVLFLRGKITEKQMVFGNPPCQQFLDYIVFCCTRVAEQPQYYASLVAFSAGTAEAVCPSQTLPCVWSPSQTSRLFR